MNETTKFYIYCAALFAIAVFGAIFAFRTIVNLVDDRTIVKKVPVRVNCPITPTPGEPSDMQIEGEVYLL